MSFSLIFTCVFISLQGCFPTNDAIGTVGLRAETPLEIEVLTVADYGAFSNWYNLLDSSIPHAQRVNYAKQNLTTWLGAMVHTANMVYKRLEPKGIYISIKLVDLLIMTSVKDSPWTETTKFIINSTYMIDSDLVHPLFQQNQTQLQGRIPHDHAMLFTNYTLIHPKKGTQTFAGNAYLGAECKARSQSIVKDSRDSYTANTIAHEIGHSLGCEHDSENNDCKAGEGYLMEADFVENNTKKWTFSNCSINYIKTFINQLNSQHRNCLSRTDDNHALAQLGTVSQNWAGHLYSHDEQCIIFKGKGSHFCRSHYEGDFTGMCLRMLCYLPDEDGDTCVVMDAADGTPCADGRVCISSVCVQNSSAPAIPDQKCVAGDQIGVVYNHKTCKEIVRSSPNDCLRRDVKYLCCDSCKHAHTTSVPVDEQCRTKFGSRSYFCRNSNAYTTSFSTMCEDLFCKNTTVEDICNGMRAYDKTPCGNRKWCMDGKCVSDSRAPAVSDSCPMGDLENDPGVSYLNLTCSQIRSLHNNYGCYSNYTQKACCKTCADINRHVKGCEYGDTNKDCFPLISSAQDSYNCYSGDNAKICCESCAKYRNASHVGCEYGDHTPKCATLVKSQVDSPNCYAGQNAQTCCKSCGKLYNPNRVGCEYGDKLNGCTSSKCSTYTAESVKGCCLSCHGTALVG